MPQKENNAQWRESFILKQTHFSVNTICNSMEYIDLRSSAVRQFQKVDSCLKTAK
jgi:hypothetical protein